MQVIGLVAHALEQTAALQLVEAFGDVTGHHAGLRGVVAAPLQASFAEAQERPIYSALNTRAVDAGAGVLITPNH